MTILWIPHSPFTAGAVRRDQHLIRHLQDRHRIISVTWEARSGAVSLKEFWEGIQRYSFKLSDQRIAYHVRRIPDVTRVFRRDKRQAMCLNSFFFRRDIRRIIRREEIDLMVTADSGHMTGLPPFDVEIPVIFDYLDGGTWDSPNPSVRPYITNSDAVLSVSKQATEQASQLNQNVTYLPNGADITRLRSASGNAVRKKYGLLDATVVSLIGLGASGSHYFIDAVRKARREIPELQCLLVGDSESVVQSLDRLPDSIREAFVYTGPVPYDEIASFFAASDVGIYPVDATPYDDGRCPIKVFEYTARGTPVVVPRLREVERLDFNNIVYASPEASSFAEGIVEASKCGPTQDSEVEKYDWAQIADRLDEKLRSVSQQV